MDIHDSEISIIVHGPLSHSFDMPVEKCLTQARLIYPNSQIIVATWKCEDVSRVHGLADDIIVLDQVETPRDTFGRQKLNVNAMMACVQAALRICQRKYVLKLRSDICPSSRSFTRALDCVDQTATQPCFVKKIRVSSYYTRNPLRVPMLFHLGDVVHFGLLEDMKRLWGDKLLPLCWLKSADMTPDKRIFGDWYFTTGFRMVSEQAIVLSWLEREGIHVKFDHVCHNSFINFALWERVLYTNFDIIDHNSSGILYPLRFSRDGYAKSSLHAETTMRMIEKYKASVFIRSRFVWSVVNQYVLCVFDLSWIRAAGSKVLDIYCPFLKVIIKR